MTEQAGDVLGVTLSDEPTDLLELKAAALTDAGCRRASNQDAVAVFKDPETGVHLLVLADGMGGHQGGETASSMAVALFTNAFQQRAIADVEDMTLLALEADRMVSGQVPEGGTTVVAALVSTESMSVIHVGDSRAYVIRNEHPLRITKDHSWVESQVQRGVLSPEQARKHPRRNVLTQAVGTGRQDPADAQKMRVLADDIVILCSDGLHDLLEDEEIAGIVLSAPDVETAAQMLVAAAKERGAPDNVTVALCAVSASRTNRAGGDNESDR